MTIWFNITKYKKRKVCMPDNLTYFKGAHPKKIVKNVL